ncbi:MAG: Fic family protein [Bacilli bacterium]|nr:Fic family protein [Bacilli bacterium]
MRTFDYSFLEKEIPGKIASYLFAIERNKGLAKMFEEKYPKVFINLTKIAKVQSVKASNAIEGIVTTDKRIESIVNKSVEPLNHDEKEIAGYRDALNFIHLNYETLDVDLRQILLLHRTLLNYAQSPTRGELKKTNNVIIEKSIDGTRKIRFIPVSAEETPKAMEQLELAFFDARSNSNINPLLLIPCYILDFLCIHPFDDGNGRISRLLSLLLLYKSGYNVGKYISLELIINKNKGLYYDTLYSSSNGWHENKNNYWVFIENFLMTLLSSYNELADRYEIIKDKKLSKAERVEETIKRSLGKISKEEIHKIWPDISYNTIELELSKLLKNGLIDKIGATNGVSYIWKK